jgi:hypothetical protein
MIIGMIKPHPTESDGEASGPVASCPYFPVEPRCCSDLTGQEAAARVDQVLTWSSGYLPHRDASWPNAPALSS